LPSTPSLPVTVQDQPVGSLQLDSTNRVVFLPDPEWLSRGQDPPLGLAFLREPKARRGPDYRVLPHWFENLLPEPESKLRSWICQQCHIQERDSLSLIGLLGGDLVGAVKVEGVPPPASPEATAIPVDSTQGSLRFSLAGMQLKFSMLHSGNRFVFPAQNQLGQWIVKIPGTVFADLPEVEAATMAWARAIGLPTPDFCVRSSHSLDGVDPEFLKNIPTIFAIRRFDREGPTRIHQEDFAQALEFAPQEKYGASNRGIGYDLLARLVQDVCGHKAALDFIRRVAFLVASGNGDAHLKNWSFQWLSSGPQLSPSYDLVSTISWPEFGWSSWKSPQMALSLGRKKRFQEIDRDRLTTFARRSGVLDAGEVFVNTIEQARNCWPQTAQQAPVRMRNALQEHWHKVPLLRDVGGVLPQI